ncbi:hypothetical protein [Pseudoalteromonas arctica]|uniref:hypothetical protein n=1 Tax=Pseudoalteromonas arctica TaxID=394751 RepID=UPI00200711C4|nr:hypothetical protein [Pseudoalteromonas arctica]
MFVILLINELLVMQIFKRTIAIKLILIALLIGISFFSHAKDINCKGRVKAVMDYPTYCDGGYAFITTGSNNKWICPASEKGNAIVLAALAANKSVDVYINNNNDAITCQTLPSYVKSRYIIIRA